MRLRLWAICDSKNLTIHYQKSMLLMLTRTVHIASAQSKGPPTRDMSEDCLFLNVWAPSAATPTSKLPVYFFIQGGGFNTNAKAGNGSGLVKASELNIVVVNFSYRN